MAVSNQNTLYSYISTTTPVNGMAASAKRGLQNVPQLTVSLPNEHRTSAITLFPSVFSQRHFHLHYGDSSALMSEPLSRRFPQMLFGGSAGDWTPGRATLYLGMHSTQQHSCPLTVDGVEMSGYVVQLATGSFILNGAA